MASFLEMKKRREENFSKLNSKLDSIANPSYSQEDDRFWQPVVDKEGNGYAAIRFLPTTEADLALDPDALPFFRYWDHGFKGPGGWYIENSLTTLGLADPCGEMNSEFWNSGDEAKKAFVQGTPVITGSKRRLHFVANIYVLSHPAKKEDEGKVFLYKFGKKIFDKINDASNPKIPSKKPLNAFDLWDGATFHLCIKKDAGYRSYNDSYFDSKEQLFADDEAMEDIWKKEYPLHDVIKFKTYEELEKQLKRAMGEKKGSAAQTVEQEPVQSRTRTAPKTSPERERVQEKEASPPWETEGDDEEDLNFFKNLINK